MTVLRSIMTEHWAALSATPRGSAWLTSELPVRVADRAVLCALGPDNNRHLLIPVPSGDYVRADTRSEAVHLLPLVLQSTTQSTEYANLVLLRTDLVDIFTGLCADMMAALEARTTSPLVVVSQVLDGWRELFRSGTQLGIEQLAGLFGELTFLDLLLDLDVRLVSAWRGPLRSPHDFVVGDRAVEVKATTSSEGRSVRIHGATQLEPPMGGELVLRWMRLDTSDPAGTSVPEVAAAAARRLERPQELWHLLARSGYLMADSTKYEAIRFSVVEEACFRVTELFPRIVPSSFAGGVPTGVSDLRYTVDLSQGPPPMQKDEVTDFLRSMRM
jgi:hypothetical protein